jgi:hypothetical protein
MNKIPIIQYLPLTRPKATERYTRALNKSDVMVILDLEDSAQNPFNIKKTDQLKIQARNGLDSISKKSSFKPSCNTYIRINAINTKYFEDDIQSVISACKNNLNLTGIFVPKVENYMTIKEINNRLSVVERKLEVIPMIETIEGMKNLPNILENDQNNDLFSRIHYGHFDYCLDAQIWPFSDPFHIEFWEIIKTVASLMLTYKKTYIHTPFPFPKNESLFWASSFYLKKLFPSLDIWICTLNSELSLSNQPDKIMPFNLVHSDISSDNLIKEAKIICNNFLSGRANKRSFSVSNDRFIPPHQYFAAEKYLKNLEIQ